MRKLCMFLAFAGLMVTDAWGQRSVQNFDRDWRFARYGWQADGTRKAEPASLHALTVDDSNWRMLDVPHDWGIEGPFRIELEGYTGKLPWRGIGWYRKTFALPSKDKGKCVFLDFDGAMANAEVWMNGYKIGERPFGYSSFRVDLTPYLRWGAKNVVAVRLDTERLGSRWYPGAGIYRHVRLVKTRPIHVAHWGVFVSTPEVTEARARALVRLEVQNRTGESVTDSRYSVDIYELGADDRPGRKVAAVAKRPIVLPASGTATDSVALAIGHPRLWDLEHPNRYMARVTVYRKNKRVDVYDAPFGIRTITFTHDNGFLLNGKRVQIKGVCNHHDLGALGAAVNTSAMARQLRILKGFGCNAIRTSHNPPAPDLLDLADKMGFLVMDELFDCWREGKKEYDYSTHFDRWHEKDIEMLVCRDRNHPSVILWSTGNEVPEQYNPELGIARHLTEVVHRFDTTRPATFGASYPSKSAMNGTELQVDVHGMNYAAGVYGGPGFYGEFLSKPGHEHLSGYSSESASTLSTRGEYFPRPFQMSSYDLQEPGWGGLPDWEFAALEKFPGICGEFVWTGFDYLGEPTPFNSDASVLLNHAEAMTKEELDQKREELARIDSNRPPSRSSYFGIVDLAGFPKDRYYLYQAHWMPEKPMAHILPHWNFAGREGQVTPVFVYSSGDEVELFLNGKSMGRKQKHPYEYRFRWDSLRYEPGVLEAVAYKHGKRWATDRVQTTGPAVRLRAEAEQPAIKGDGEELAFVRVSFLDKDGREVPTAEPLVTCSIEGDGEIVATDNGDPTCLVTFSEPSRPAFNGLFLAIVKAKRGARRPIRLTVKAEGLPEAVVEIPIER